MQVVVVYQARWGMTGRHLTTTQRLLESFPPLIAELNSPVRPGKVIQRPLKREDFHWEENSRRPGPIRGSSVPSRFAVPGGTNRVGAPTALRRMCWAQSGSLLLGLWLFSLPLFLYLNDDRKSSPNAVWFSAAPINKAPSDPTGGRGTEKKRQGLLYLPICSFSLGILWSWLCLCSESSGLGKWGRDLSACPHLWSTVNYL